MPDLRKLASTACGSACVTQLSAVNDGDLHCSATILPTQRSDVGGVSGGVSGNTQSPFQTALICEFPAQRTQAVMPLETVRIGVLEAQRPALSSSSVACFSGTGRPAVFDKTRDSERHERSTETIANKGIGSLLVTLHIRSLHNHSNQVSDPLIPGSPALRALRSA